MYLSGNINVYNGLVMAFKFDDVSGTLIDFYVKRT